MDLSSLTDRIKSVPPIAWVIGAGVIILVVVLGRGKGSGGVTGSGGGGAGAGEVESDINQQIVDLAAAIAANTAADAAFRDSILGHVNSGGGTPRPRFTPPVRGIPGGSSSGSVGRQGTQGGSSASSSSTPGRWFPRSSQAGTSSSSPGRR